MNNIIALSAFTDNYIWTLYRPEKSKVVVVDPGDANPVLSFLHKNNLSLSAILLTHHHHDHSGGILKLIEAYPNIAVYGSAKESVPGITHPVQDGDEIHLEDIQAHFKIMDIPGHTLGHIAYYGENSLFCGDTLFSCGCGRIFEGTPQQMLDSLDKLKALPKSTQMYCGHEYTQANLEFVMQVTPNNTAVKQRLNEANTLRKKQMPTLPVLLETELLTNPFLRVDENEVILAVLKHAKINNADRVKVFTILREWKNNFAR